MSNVSSIISKHNKKVLAGGQNLPPVCECENLQCPVEGKCNSSGVVYQASVRQNGETVDSYVGLTERKFINRYNEHLTNFESRNPKNSTKLSKKVWDLNDRQQNFEIKWEILKYVKPYQAGNRDCRLCLMEILIILFQSEKANLNSRHEMFNKCRQKNKFKLAKI